ncbi:MAG: DNA polymerase-3 subunit epsilon, partial [Gammaproteobacteria bacterium]
MIRQVILDTETTGLETSQGHRIIEIGCVEVINRRITNNHYHQYINPDRNIDAGAFDVHGISSEFLSDKPMFAEISNDFIKYIDGAELVIHNAPFDIGFIDSEFSRLNPAGPVTEQICGVLDTLVLARQKHPGQKNNLDALCRRYMIDNSQRSLHGALLDARILADVYLVMTGGQESLGLDDSGSDKSISGNGGSRHSLQINSPLPLWELNAQDQNAHRDYLKFIADQCDNPVWT